ncbi:MAG: Stealth CR1 domain-containing protein [Saccharofermentans sp.]|nr:Stealth CR1 domain-containing protein [Saccharofermentans sp.]
MKNLNDYDVDIVITWVDGNDPLWQSEYNRYKGESGDKTVSRFRDTNTLKYLFRGIEKFAPWVRKVFFVTCGQRPDWLNLNCDKLECVSHSDFMPERYLPTFSSHAIELNFHRIKGLSDRFIYFNDDFFLVNSTVKRDFFEEGLPKDNAVLTFYVPERLPMFFVPMANTYISNHNFDKKQVISQNRRKYFSLKNGKYILNNLSLASGNRFPGFKAFHIPSSFLKSAYNEIWEAEPEILESTSCHKFRVLTDVNQWAIQDWQRCKGDFIPRELSFGTFFNVTNDEDIKAINSYLLHSKYKCVCINDDGVDNFDAFKEELTKCFEELLPEKSLFEK